jgi:hypothetical protein
MNLANAKVAQLLIPIEDFDLQFTFRSRISALCILRSRAKA